MCVYFKHASLRLSAPLRLKPSNRSRHCRYRPLSPRMTTTRRDINSYFMAAGQGHQGNNNNIHLQLLHPRALFKNIHGNGSLSPFVTHSLRTTNTIQQSVDPSIETSRITTATFTRERSYRIASSLLLSSPPTIPYLPIPPPSLPIPTSTATATSSSSSLPPAAPPLRQCPAVRGARPLPLSPNISFADPRIQHTYIHPYIRIRTHIYTKPPP